MTFDLRTWALHDAVFQLARESGLDSFRVECRQGPEGETVIALVLRNKNARTAPIAESRPFVLCEKTMTSPSAKKGQ